MSHLLLGPWGCSSASRCLPPHVIRCPITISSLVFHSICHKMMSTSIDSFHETTDIRKIYRRIHMRILVIVFYLRTDWATWNSYTNFFQKISSCQIYWKLNFCLNGRSHIEKKRFIFLSTNVKLILWLSALCRWLKTFEDNNISWWLLKATGGS